MPLEVEEVAPPATIPRFHFEGLGVSKALFEILPTEPAEDGEQRPDRISVELQIGAAIHMNQDAKRAVVTLDIHVMPDRKWQPYRVQITIAGAFTAENATVEQLDQFCRLGVPPILFPYIREKVHHMTLDAPKGPVRLDPVNIAGMLNSTAWIRAETPSSA